MPGIIKNMALVLGRRAERPEQRQALDLTSIGPGAILGLFDIWSTSAFLPRRR